MPIADGGAASLAYEEFLAPETTDARRKELRRDLLAYCKLDTLATVEIYRELSGDR